MAVSDLHCSLSQEVLPSAALLAASLQPPRGLLGRRAAVRSARSQAKLDAARQPGSGGGSQAGLHPGSVPAEPEAGSDPSEEGAVKAAAVTAGVAAGAGHALSHIAGAGCAWDCQGWALPVQGQHTSLKHCVSTTPAQGCAVRCINEVWGHSWHW